MKNRYSFLFSLLALFCIFLSTGKAEERNGFLISVQKTTLTKDDYDRGGYYSEMIDRTLGLKINLKNVTMKPMEAGTLEYTIIVLRWDYSPPRYDRYAGSVPVAALKPQEAVNLVAGSAKIGGYKNYANRQYQDKIEGWKVVIKQGETEKVSFQSGSSFDSVNKKAVKADS